MAGSGAPVGVAVLGAGMIGAAHATAYLLQSTASGDRGVPVRLVAAIDADRDAAEALRRRFGFERAGVEWREVLDDPAIEAVSIALPNELHFEVARALFGAGKHVICEKPLAILARDARELMNLAESAGVVAATSFNYRRFPAIAAIRERLAAGELGESIQFVGHYHADYAADPMLPFSWRYEKRRAGGGALTDIGVHLIDLARFCCGEVERVDGASLATVIPRRPLAAGRTTGHDRGAILDEVRDVDTDDVVSLTLTFTTGCRGTLSLSRIAIGQKNALGFLVSGTRGSAIFDSDQPTAFRIARAGADGWAEGFATVLSDASHPYVRHGIAVPAAGVPYGYSEIFSFMLGEFLSAVRDGGRMTNGTLRDGYEAALVVEAVEHAAIARRAITIEEVRRNVEETPDITTQPPAYDGGPGEGP